mmetsp:Transcript_58430/g.107866  ORF Transcript_58430/g.107866 Transcript_58430/m.107866 type:complete len:389 (+) Transcript_58430:70-1236(+)
MKPNTLGRAVHQDDADLEEDSPRHEVEGLLRGANEKRRHRSHRLTKASHHKIACSVWQRLSLCAAAFMLVALQVWIGHRLHSISANLQMMRGYGRRSGRQHLSNARESHDRSGSSLVKGGGKYAPGLDHYYWMTANVSTPAARLNHLKPLAWVQVPWAGDGFLNTLLHHPYICPGFRSHARFTANELSEAHFKKQVSRACAGAFIPNYDSPPYSVGFGDAYFRSVGHAVIVLRHPARRVLTEFLHSGAAAQGGSITSLASQRLGCTVRTIVRLGRSPCLKSDSAPSEREAAQAVKFLQQGFAFVGIAEEWELTVCLFHQIFGGPCHSFELKDMTDSQEEAANNSAALQAMKTDALDEQVYLEGVRRFQLDKQSYGVSQSSCLQLCTSA